MKLSRNIFIFTQKLVDDVWIPLLLVLTFFWNQNPWCLEVRQRLGSHDVDVPVIAVISDHPLL